MIFYLWTSNSFFDEFSFFLAKFFEFNSDFSPVAMDIQLNEYNKEEYNITKDKVLQGNAIIESFHNSIMNLNIKKSFTLNNKIYHWCCRDRWGGRN